MYKIAAVRHLIYRKVKRLCIQERKKYTKKILMSVMLLLLMCSSLMTFLADSFIQNIKLGKIAIQLNEDDETTI